VLVPPHTPPPPLAGTVVPVRAKRRHGESSADEPGRVPAQRRWSAPGKHTHPLVGAGSVDRGPRSGLHTLRHNTARTGHPSLDTRRGTPWSMAMGDFWYPTASPCAGLGQ